MATSSTASSGAIKAALLLLLGGASTLTAQQLFSTAAQAGIPSRFQNSHVWVASLNPDAGQPVYAGKTCAFLLTPDAGNVSTCSYDGAELTYTQGKSFEAFLKTLGVPVPR